MDQEGSTAIRAFLAAEAPLVLVVWDNDCPECLDNMSETGDVDLERFGL